MTFNVPSFTANYGHSTLYKDDYILYRHGTHGDGVPTQGLEVIGRGTPWAFTRRMVPDKQKRYIPGSDILYAKFYDRQVGRVITNTPWVERRRDYGYTALDMYYDRNHNYHEPDAKLPPSWGEDHGLLINEAHTKALNKLREGRMELGVDLLESRKTLDTVAGRSIQLLEAYRAARRGRWGQLPSIFGYGRRRGKRLSSDWLEYQYGWLPLMGSIHDGAQLLQSGFRKPQLSFCKASAVRDYEHEESGDRFEKSYGKDIVKVGLTYRVANATTDMFDRAGLTNPLSIAWELVPFSFVLDWFIPVGNVMSALSATAGLEFIDGYRTEARHSHYVEHQIKTSDKVWQSDVVEHGEFHCETMHHLRRPLDGFPSPGFYVNRNPFGKDIDPRHPFKTPRVVNALALLRQLL